MKTIAKSLAAGIVGVAIASTPAFAAKMHPITGEKLADEQTFTYRVLDEHSSLDPQIVEDVTGSEISRDLFEGLVNQNPDGTLVPGVAQRWTTNANKDVYTFYLRKNAVWSNGDPVTAHDFVFAWTRLVDPKTASPYAWFGEIMSIKNGAEIIAGEKDPSTLGVKALDDRTFQVTLSASLPYFPMMLTHTSTFPVPKKVVENLGEDWTKPGNLVSNGAYMLKEHVVNERMVRVRNPQYWNNDATIVDKVVSLVINDENQAFNRYLADELDKTEVPTGQFKRLKKEMPVETHSFPRLCSYYYNFNIDKAPYNDVRVRQALSYAIDRDIIVNQVLGGGQIAAYTFTPAATADFNVPNVKFSAMSQKDRDAKAKELLAAAGFDKSNPLETTILYNTSEGHKKIAIAISQMWKQKLGVQTTLENQEWKTFLTTRGDGDFEVARAGWCGDYNEASTFLDLMTSESGYNDSNYNNPEVDQLMKTAKTMSDPNANYTKVEEIVAEEFPIAPIYHYAGNLMLKSWVGGWPFENVEQNWYSRNLYIKAH